MKTFDLVEFLDNLLQIHDVVDDSLNGLQVANRGTVRKVALAVDASLLAIQNAREASADFLFVHHGLFWGKSVRIIGTLYDRICNLVESDMAFYAAHIPLDKHPELGNNAQIEKILGWPVVGDFGEYRGSPIGKEIRFKKAILLDELVKQFGEGLNCHPRVWAFGSKKIKRIGYVSGGAMNILEQAVDEDLDAYVTGEPKHDYYWFAKEAGINVIFGGHYATETLGVKAIGKAIHKKFGLETFFIDLPTGL